MICTLEGSIDVKYKASSNVTLFDGLTMRYAKDFVFVAVYLFIILCLN